MKRSKRSTPSTPGKKQSTKSSKPGPAQQAKGRTNQPKNGGAPFTKTERPSQTGEFSGSTREHSLKLRFRVPGIETDDLPPLTRDIDAFMIVALVRSADLSWRKGFKANALNQVHVDFYSQKHGGRIPYPIVFRAALRDVASEHLGPARRVGLIEDEGPDRCFFDSMVADRAHRKWYDEISAFLSDRTLRNPQSPAQVAAAWVSRLMPAIGLLNPIDYEKANKGDAKTPFDAAASMNLGILKKRLKALAAREGRVISDEVDTELLERAATIRELVLDSTAATNDGTSLGTCLYMDLNDGTVHLDMWGIAKEALHELSTRPKRKSENEPNPMKNLVAPEESRSDADHLEVLRMLDELHSAVQNSPAERAELEWMKGQHCKEGGDPPSREVIAAREGTTVAKMRKASDRLRLLAMALRGEEWGL